MHNPPMELKHKLLLHTQTQRIPIDIEVALSPEERARGLMCRTDLEENQGMMFFFNPPEVISMWMKNTPLSLDILFFNHKAMLIKTHERAVPYSEELLSSDHDTMFVLELNAGFVQKHNIKIGDHFEIVQ